MAWLRLWLIVILAGLALPASAATVGGRVYLKGTTPQYGQITIGYLGYQNKTQWTQLTGQTAPGTDNFSTSGQEQAREYPLVMMSWAKGGACTYQCTKLQPGLYTFFARIGNYVDWKTAYVPNGNGSFAINFSMNPKRIGSLKVIVPKDYAHKIHLAPAWDTDNVNWRMERGPRTTEISAESERGDGDVLVPSLRDGKYLLEVDRVTGKTLADRMWHGDKRVGQWVVTIKSGQVTSFRLPN